ncbi:MAG: hypothetical protein AAFU85_02010 [Planctomycetota bacterium]
MPFFFKSVKKRKNSERAKRQLVRRLARVEPLENRRVLANLNLLTASGTLAFGAAPATADNALVISYDAGTDTYEFTDPTETINAIGGLAGIATGSGTNTVTFTGADADAAVADGSLDQIRVNLNNGNDSLTVNGFRAGGEGLSTLDTDVAGTDTITINGDVGTGGSPVTIDGVNLVGDVINLNANIIASGVGVTLGAAGSDTPVVIGAAVEVAAAGATALINTGTGASGVTGSNDLSVSGSSVQLRGDIGLSGAAAVTLNADNLLQVGSATENSSLSSGTGNISLTGGTEVTLTDGIMTGGDVSSTSPITSMGSAAGSISGNTITISANLSNTTANTTVLNALADVNVGGPITSSSAVDVDAGGNVDFDGTVTTSVGDINVAATDTDATSFQAAGSVIVTGGTTFTGVGAVLVSADDSISFEDVTGNGANLTLFAPTSIASTGTISNVATFRASDGGAAGAVAISLVDVDADEVIVLAGGGLTLSGAVAANDGVVSITADITVDGTVSVTSGGDAGENVLIDGDVDGTVADADSVTLDAPVDSALTVTGDIGDGVRLLDVTLSGDTINANNIDLAGDFAALGGNIQIAGSASGDGTGTATLAPSTPGRALDIFNDPTNTRVGNATRITETTISSLQAGTFAELTIGNAGTSVVRINPDNDNSTTTGALDLVFATNFVGEAINLSEDLDQGLNAVTFETDAFGANRALVSTGDVSINKLTAGGTLELRGKFGTTPSWGALNLSIDAVGATINAPAAGSPLPILGPDTGAAQTFLGGFNLASFTIDADTVNASGSAAIESAGEVTLNVDQLNLTGGIRSGGNIVLGNPGGTVTNAATGVSILATAGSDVTIANIGGNAGDVLIRGLGGKLGTVSIEGGTDGGLIRVGSNANNGATTLNVDGLSAEAIVLRGDSINLNGTVEATGGSNHIIGAVTLTGDSSLENSSGVPTNFVRVDGTIDGAFDLDIDSGLGSTVLTGAIGAGTALANMSVASGGTNNVTVPITVAGDFSWIVGTAGNGLNDRLVRIGAGSITAGGTVTLEADTLARFEAGVNVFGTTVTLTIRGNGD